ncbi:MAG: 2-hydroxyacid dehydrogenase [Thermoplasmata archaeon]
MKVLVSFMVDAKIRKMGNDILGKGNVIWYPSVSPAEILLIRDNNFPYDENVKFIQTITAGIDHIDISSLKEGTIVASNAGAYSISVAEHAFALLMERAKKICIKRDETLKGIFNPESTQLLYGKTIGIIGYGGIGSRVAEISKVMGMKVAAIGRGYRDKNVDIFLSLDKLNDIFKISDFIVISIPLTKLTHELITKDQLSLMKKNAIIVNVARAEIVKREDMLNHLNNNPDFSYLTDVWWDEPNLKDTDFSNLVVTPHIAGGRSGEIMEFAFKQAFQNIKNFMENKEVKNVVKNDENIVISRKSLGV